MYVRSNFLLSIIKKYSRMAAFVPSSQKPMDEIRNHLAKFTGGSIDLIKREDGLAIVQLNHKEKKNAMSGKMMVDLYDVVEELDTWMIGKGIILKGSSGDFCSGGDLDFVRRTGTAEEGFMMSTYMQTILNKFQRLPMISVALIEGIGALGGGSELTVSCDFALMSETCKGIGFVHAKMGLVPAWGGTTRLIDKIGYSKALDVLSTAKLLSPQECLRIGLIDDIIPGEENAENYAISWLQKRTRLEMTRHIKSCVSLARDFPRDYEKERRFFAPFWGGPAHREAINRNIKHRPESE